MVRISVECTGDVRVDLLAGDELQLVDHALVVGVRHGHEDAVAADQDRQDPACLGHFARHNAQVIEHDGHLGEVDPGHAMLLGQRAQSIRSSVDRALRSPGPEASGWAGETDRPACSGRHRAAAARPAFLEQGILAERPLLVAGHGVAGGRRALVREMCERWGDERDELEERDERDAGQTASSLSPAACRGYADPVPASMPESRGAGPGRVVLPSADGSARVEGEARSRKRRLCRERREQAQRQGSPPPCRGDAGRRASSRPRSTRRRTPRRWGAGPRASGRS